MIRRCVSQALDKKQMAFSKGVEEFPDIRESPGYRRGPLGRCWGLGRGKEPGPIPLWREQEGTRGANTPTSPKWTSPKDGLKGKQDIQPRMSL